MHEQDLTPDWEAFAAQLAALTPTTEVSRDRVMYEAGRAAAAVAAASIVRRAAWPAATLVVGMAALWLGRTTAPPHFVPIYAFAQPHDGPAAVADAETSERAEPRETPDSYGRLRGQLGSADIAQAGFTNSGPAARVPASRQYWLHELLN